MKIFRRLCLMLLCLVPTMAMAQGEVKWSHSVADKGNGSYTVQFKAQIENGWHIYVNDPAKAFNPTELTFEPGEGVTLEGGLRALSKAKYAVDELLGMEIGEFEKEALFEQDFKVEGKGGEVKASISYQACNVGSCTS